MDGLQVMATVEKGSGHKAPATGTAGGTREILVELLQPAAGSDGSHKHAECIGAEGEPRSPTREVHAHEGNRPHAHLHPPSAGVDRSRVPCSAPRRSPAASPRTRRPPSPAGGATALRSPFYSSVRVPSARFAQRRAHQAEAEARAHRDGVAQQQERAISRVMRARRDAAAGVEALSTGEAFVELLLAVYGAAREQRPQSHEVGEEAGGEPTGRRSTGIDGGTAPSTTAPTSWSSPHAATMDGTATVGAGAGAGAGAGQGEVVGEMPWAQLAARTDGLLDLESWLLLTEGVAASSGLLASRSHLESLFRVAARQHEAADGQALLELPRLLATPAVREQAIVYLAGGVEVVDDVRWRRQRASLALMAMESASLAVLTHHGRSPEATKDTDGELDGERAWTEGRARGTLPSAAQEVPTSAFVTPLPGGGARLLTSQPSPPLSLSSHDYVVKQRLACASRASTSTTTKTAAGTSPRSSTGTDAPLDGVHSLETADSSASRGPTWWPPRPPSRTPQRPETADLSPRSRTLAMAAADEASLATMAGPVSQGRGAEVKSASADLTGAVSASAHELVAYSPQLHRVLAVPTSHAQTPSMARRLDASRFELGRPHEPHEDRAALSVSPLERELELPQSAVDMLTWQNFLPRHGMADLRAFGLNSYVLQTGRLAPARMPRRRYNGPTEVYRLRQPVALPISRAHPRR